MPDNYDRAVTLVTPDGEFISGTNPLPTSGGSGPGSNVVVTDIEDGAGDSVMDAANNAVRVNIVAGAGSGGTAQADKSTFTEGTTTFTPVGGVFNETVSADPTEDQAAAARITAKRGLHINLRNVAGTEIGTAAAPVRTDPTGTTTQPVSDAGGSLTVDGSVSIGSALPAGTNNIGDVDVLSLPAATVAGATVKTLDYDTGGGTDTVPAFGVLLPASGGAVAGGTSTNPVRTDPTGTTAQPVTDNGGSLTVDGTVTVNGDVAHDGVDSGNPNKIGAKAIAHGSNPTAVAAADRTDLYANRHGVLFTIGGHPNSTTLRATYTTGQTDTAIVTVSSGTKIVVTRVLVTVSKATSVNTDVIIGFGGTNTPTTTQVVAAHPGIEAGGGFNTGDGSGILGIGADGEDLRITSGAPTSGRLDVVVTYYTIES
jgi:hypothetical protein